jgi:DNA-binding response OmpR family regulator
MRSEYTRHLECVRGAAPIGLAHQRLATKMTGKQKMKILIVEDQRRVGSFVERAFAEHNYVTRLVGSCAAAWDAITEDTYDAIVLDLHLPDGDGLELLKEWRTKAIVTPILILSARDAVEDRIKGLNLGADDYLPKPFSVDELIARVRSLIRRNSSVRSTVLVHGPIRLDLVSHVVTRDGERVELTNREYELLELFLHNPTRLLTRTFIAERVWETDYDLETNLIDVYVRRLRRKLEVQPDRPVIRTVRGSGYQLV